MRFLPPILILAAGLLAFHLHTSALRPRESVLRESGSTALTSDTVSASRRPSPQLSHPSRVEALSSEGGKLNRENSVSSSDLFGGDAEPKENETEMDEGAIRGALEELAAKNNPEDDALRHRLMERWGAKHPEALAGWAAGLAPDQGRGQVLSQALMIWAETDLEAAIAFAHTEQLETTRTDLLLGLAHESLHHDARRGLELAAELPVTTERDELLEKGVMEWAASDSNLATNWVRQVESVALREKLMAAAAIGMAETQSFEAASLAAASIQSIQERDRAVVSILQRWVQSEPVDAMEWLGRFPEGDLKRSAARSTVVTWEAKDPEAARAWVHALPAGSLKEWASLAIHP